MQATFDDNSNFDAGNPKLGCSIALLRFVAFLGGISWLTTIAVSLLRKANHHLGSTLIVCGALLVFTALSFAFAHRHRCGSAAQPQ